MPSQIQHPDIDPPRLQVLPLTSVFPKDDFNPRGTRDTTSFAQLCASVAERGVRQPILVAPDPTNPDRYRIVAGERRYLAAEQAGLLQIPCLIDTVDPDTDGLDDALIENLLRENLSVLDEARAIGRLREQASLTIRGIAQRLQRSQRLVRERLALLTLPESLHQQIDTGRVPLSAVPALVRLTAIHPDLAPIAVQRVLGPPARSWDTATTWEDFTADPIAVVIGRYPEQIDDLPAGVFVAGHEYSVDRFTVSEQATGQLAQLATLLAVEPEQVGVRFARELTAQALALGAAFPSEGGYEHLIVGQDVADQLASDCVAQQLKLARKQAKQARQNGHAAPSAAASGGPALSDEERLERARLDREQAKAAAVSARARNTLLGAQLTKHLASVKVDERVLRILTAAPLASDLEKIAMRGARLTFPGWQTEQPLKNGTMKVTYLSGRESLGRARAYLDGASKPGEIAGRCLALLAAARWASEDAIPRSQRSAYELRLHGYRSEEHVPWATEVGELLDEILIERLSPEASEPIRCAQHDRQLARETEAEAARQRDAALLALAEQAAGLTADERQAHIDEIRKDHGFSAIDASMARTLISLADPGEEPDSESAKVAVTETDNNTSFAVAA